MEEQKDIDALLERYLNAETTVEEERWLGDYLRALPSCPPQWEPFRLMLTASFPVKSADEILAEDFTAEFDAEMAARRRKRRLGWMTRWSVAAVLVMMAAVGAWFYGQRSGDIEVDAAQMSYANEDYPLPSQPTKRAIAEYRINSTLLMYEQIENNIKSYE